MSLPDGPDGSDDPAEHRPRPLMGLGFWAMIALCLVCVLAGAAVAYITPRLLGGAEPAGHPVAN